MDALILGLSSGASCLASCAPFVLPALALESGSRRARRLALMGVFLSGRLLSYIAVGAIVGGAGALAAGFLAPALDRALLRAGWALGGIVLLLGGLAGFESQTLCRRLAAGERPLLASFALGVAAGLNLCPPFLAATSRALALGAFGGASYFLVFFLGTSAWVLPLALFPAWKKKAAELRAVARVAMTLLGAYFLVALGLLGWS